LNVDASSILLMTTVSRAILAMSCVLSSAEWLIAGNRNQISENAARMRLVVGRRMSLLKISALTSQTEGDHEPCASKNLRFKVEDSADGMQLESDSDAVQASEVGKPLHAYEKVYS
jgi:hypothetical protein